MKLDIKKNAKTIKIAKIVIASILGLMIVTDIVLVILGLNNDNVPTFSKVIKDHRTGLIWLNFLLGGLIAKIFYNRKVYTKRKEISGFFAFVAVSFVLVALGQLLPEELGNGIHLLIMVCGGILAHIAWPQYTEDEAAQ